MPNEILIRRMRKLGVKCKRDGCADGARFQISVPNNPLPFFRCPRHTVTVVEAALPAMTNEGHQVFDGD